MSKICLVIVTYNRVDVLLKNLDYVYSQTILPNKIVVVDNASTDDTVKIIKQKHPDINLIEMQDNLGFASGLAAGMKANVTEDFDYFWLMDDDSFPPATFLEQQLSIIPKACGILGSLGFIHHYFNQTEINRGEVQEVDFVLVDCALVAMEAVRKVGFPDGNLFMMCEDLDYCKRIKKSGYTIICLPFKGINRLHLGSSKSSKSLVWRSYYHSRNHLIILKKNFTFKYLCFYISMQSKFIIATLVRFDFVKTYLRIRGIIDGLRNRLGKTLDPKTLKFKYFL